MNKETRLEILKIWKVINKLQDAILGLQRAVMNLNNYELERQCKEESKAESKMKEGE